MRRTKEEAENTKKAIIEAAVKVMNEKGISATRFEDIAEEANVTRGAIYYYFKNKNEIIITIHQKMKKQVMDLFETFISDSVDPLVSIKNGFKEVFSRFENDKKYRDVEELFLKARFTSLFKQDKELCKIANEEQKDTISEIMELIKRAQETGSLRKDIHPDNIGYILVSFYLGFITTWLAMPNAPKSVGLLDDYIDVMLHGMTK